MDKIAKFIAHPLRSLRRQWIRGQSKRFIEAEATCVPTYPPNITIELTNVCNLRCPLCPTGNKTQTRKPGIMKYEHAVQIIDEVAPGCGSLGLHSYGESILHKDFHRIVDYATSKGMHTYVDANLNSVKTREQARRLVQSNLSEIKISLDGASHTTYAKYRVGGRYDVVERAIRWMVEARGGHCSPTIALQFLVMRHNESRIQDFIRLATELGVDRYDIHPIWFDLQAKDQSSYEEFLPENPDYRWYSVTDGKLALKSDEDAFCNHPFTQMLIYCNGDVGFCCLDFQSQILFGNVLEHGVLPVWNGAEMQSVRDQIQNGIRAIKPCSTCPGSRRM